MAEIQALQRTVYRAPTRGREFLTPRAAAEAEAAAMMRRKYPNEAAEYENGMCHFPGWNWRLEPTHEKTHARLSRLILRSLRRSTKPSKGAA